MHAYTHLHTYIPRHTHTYIHTSTKLTNKTLTTSYAQAANTPTTNHTNTDIRLITDTYTNYTATIENIAKYNRIK